VAVSEVLIFSLFQNDEWLDDTRKKAKKVEKTTKIKNKSFDHLIVPIRPLSAYLAFDSERRAELLQMYPASSVIAVAAQTKGVWSRLTVAERAPFQAIADADAVRYEREMKAYATSKRGRADDEEEDEEEEEENDRVVEKKNVVPEPPLTRYNAFSLSRLSGLLQRGLSREDANRAIGAEWVGMSDAAHAHWQTIADADVARFEREMEAFDLAGSSSGVEVVGEENAEEADEKRSDKSVRVSEWSNCLFFSLSFPSSLQTDYAELESAERAARANKKSRRRKRPLTAYQLYLSKRCAELKPTDGVAQRYWALRTVAGEWREMTEQEKAPFEAAAKERSTKGDEIY
jgi:hypothetical protein